MLNYVWAALIFLGIAAALTTDIRDVANDTFRKGQSIEASVKFTDAKLTALKKFPAVVSIAAKTASAFYGKEIDKDISFKAEITPVSDTSATAYLKIDENAPAVIRTIAKSSGNEDDISATIAWHGHLDAETATIIQLKPEEVSFSKINEVTAAVLDYAERAVTISLGLIGVMALWLGIMKIAEAAGVIALLSKALTPITRLLFPDVPKDHPAIGAMIMNISANFLGLGNAATPFGLKAMEELDKLNPEKGTATNAMCMFLTINTAGMTLIPATAIALRASAGSSEPAIIIGTSLFGSSCATIMGILSAKILENFPLRGKSIFQVFREKLKTFIALGVLIALVTVFLKAGGTSVFHSASNSSGTIKTIIQTVSIAAIPFLIAFFILLGFIKKVKVYEQFIEGAKEGFNIAVRIIPYLVAMLCAIGIFRAGGAMDWLIWLLKFVTDPLGMPAEALPMALMRPLSGSGSLGVMAEIMAVHGPDSFIGKLVSTFYGSSETTFYVLAVYFGSVQIKKTRHALPAGLIADIAGMLGALFIVRMLFA